MNLPDLDTKYMLREMTSIPQLIRLYKHCAEVERTFEPITPTMKYIIACGDRIINDEAFLQHRSDVEEFGEDIVIGFPTLHENPCYYTAIRQWCEFGRENNIFDQNELITFKLNTENSSEFLKANFENENSEFDQEFYISHNMSQEIDALQEEKDSKEFLELLKKIK